MTLDVSHSPAGEIAADELNHCNSFKTAPCTNYLPPRVITIGGFPATLNFLTDGTVHYLSAVLKRQNEAVDFNVPLPFIARGTYAPLPSDDAAVQDIFIKMVSTFQFSTPFEQ